MKKPNYIDIDYKGMLVRITYNGLEYTFNIIKGEGSLSSDDKFELIKMVSG